MTPEQREELKQAAMNATAGQWTSYETRVYLPPMAGGFDLRGSPNAEANVKHIALANPAAILSLIVQVEALTVPEGWKLVPIEATRDMVLAGAKHTTPAEDDDTDSQQCYFIGLGRAACAYVEMIDAAPTIPAIPVTKEGA